MSNFSDDLSYPSTPGSSPGLSPESYPSNSPEPNIKKSICPNLPDLDLSISKDWIKNSKKNDFNERNANYTGPTSESNWVIKPNLLVGAYPNAPGEYPNTPRNILETNEIQEKILNEGITTFISLNAEYGTSDEFTAYATDTENDIQLYGTNGIKKIAEKLSKEEPKFKLFPIIDMNEATDDNKLLEFCENLKQKLCDGEKLYIHCRGGHGRTGTVVAILLYILYNIEPTDAFNYIQFAHDQRIANIYGRFDFTKQITDQDKDSFTKGQVPTPQTQKQRDQVKRIVDRLKLKDTEVPGGNGDTKAPGVNKVSEGGKRKQKTNKKRRTNKKKKTQKKRKLYRK
jgi:hypothetical protein